MKKKVRNTRQDVIDFFNKYHRAPTVKESKPLVTLMYWYIKRGDEEIIALNEKYKDNTKKHTRDTVEENLENITLERISKIKKQFEETGTWPKSPEADYQWVSVNKFKSEEVMKIWDEMHKDRPTYINESKKVSELTKTEVHMLLRLIGDKTVAELTKKQKEHMKVDVSKIETILSENDIRTIINPDNNEVIVTNPKWERCKEIVEGIYADEDFKSHLASNMLKDSTFVKEVAIFMRDNPRKMYYAKIDNIVERIYEYLPASEKFFKNPANIRDLVTNCF